MSMRGKSKASKLPCYQSFPDDQVAVSIIWMMHRDIWNAVKGLVWWNCRIPKKLEKVLAEARILREFRISGIRGIAQRKPQAFPHLLLTLLYQVLKLDLTRSGNVASRSSSYLVADRTRHQVRVNKFEKKTGREIELIRKKPARDLWKKNAEQKGEMKRISHIQDSGLRKRRLDIKALYGQLNIGELAQNNESGDGWGFASQKNIGMLKTLEIDTKGYSTHSSSQSPSHSAFFSTTSTSKKMSYAESPSLSLSTTYSAPSSSKARSHSSGNVLQDVLRSLVAKSEPEQQVAYEDFEQIDKLDLEEMDIKWKMAMLSVRVNKFEKKAGRKIEFDKKEAARFNKKAVRCYKCLQKGHFARECRAKGGNEQRYSSFKIRELGKKEADTKALITIDTLEN
ncbi:ribonuclease H-like domain-containing protein [Tanacetum coccineum]|uniref:Ribonuclease H-like domain-containing protein n=1 Tax=Tanacetum coccineum TaxID=301880 RepID=A0ABQ5H2E7_9ASTR